MTINSSGVLRMWQLEATLGSKHTDILGILHMNKATKLHGKVLHGGAYESSSVVPVRDNAESKH
jgi:hypothetical protein